MSAGVSPSNSSLTRDRILEVAQEQFAQDGFERVSLRHITQAAGVNLAAVHYHFGSKEALIDRVIERFVNPINERRLGLLADLEARFGAAPVPIREIVAAFIRPAVSVMGQSELSRRLFFKLMGRCLTDPARRIPEGVHPLLRQVSQRYPAAILRTAPHLTISTILWRLHFTVGALAHAMSHSETLVALADGRAGDPSSGEILQMLVDYCSAGLLHTDTRRDET